MKYRNRLVLMILICALLVFAVAYTGMTKNIDLSFLSHRVVYREEAVSAPTPEGYAAPKPVLVLYSASDPENTVFAENIADVLRYRRQEPVLLDIGRTETVSYSDYDMVVIATMNLESEMKDDPRRITGYVEQGGKLFYAMLPETTGIRMQSIHRALGIVEYSDYITFDNLFFDEDLLLGLKGQSLQSEEFYDVGLYVTLFDSARVYLSADVNGHYCPIFWTYDHGEGRVGVWNATMLSGDFFRGMIAGCMNAIDGTVMYPVVNALCVFVDDFPSPQYDLETEAVRSVYNRSAIEFYRDIWWPDMQASANRYGFLYTGLFVSTYNDVVNPKEFYFTEPSMMQYYGNSLLRSGHEMGAHGYNHQSLAEEGLVPEDMEYNAWASESDMEASLEEMQRIAKRLFPGVSFRCYVPPSNYMSQWGRQAVVSAIPSLEIIAGMYTNEEADGAVYVQRFEVAEDGIVEFPRVTSDMVMTPFTTMAWHSALTLHGVFSHFIHPDDIFDDERGAGRTWEEMHDGFDQMLRDVNACTKGMHKFAATSAADAVRAYDAVVPSLCYREDRIDGSLAEFHGEVFFFLYTNQEPRSADDGCRLNRLSDEENGHYYLEQVTKPTFTILLEDGQ